MVSQRNRILNLVNYLESLGVIVNIGKNKARGNRGFFKAVNNNYRIDIANNLSEEDIIKVLIHEFGHFLHYQHDKTLKKLDFILPDFSDEIHEELISLTVDSIPKKNIKPLFELKSHLEESLSECYNPFSKRIKQKQLKSINSKIQRLNRYYNSPAELFARSIEAYILDSKNFAKKAPNLWNIYTKHLDEDKIPLLKDLKNMFND